MGERASYLIEWLEALNRKERYYLVRQGLGGFELTPSFSHELGEHLGLAIPTAECRAWMDYHLDWVYAAITLREQNPFGLSAPLGPFPSPNFRELDPDVSKKPVYVNTNQEDIDLLVAYREGSVHRLLFVEAKADTSWNEKQLLSKVFRLKRIFLDIPDDIVPQLLLISKSAPPFAVPVEAPRWVAPEGRWVHMDLVMSERHVKLERWDESLGKAGVEGKSWRALPSK